MNTSTTIIVVAAIGIGAFVLLKNQGAGGTTTVINQAPAGDKGIYNSGFDSGDAVTLGLGILDWWDR